MKKKLEKPIKNVTGRASKNAKIRMEDGLPVIYKPERIGLHGKPFFIYKFRSMRVDAEKDSPGVTSYATLYNGYTDTMERKCCRRL